MSNCLFVFPDNMVAIKQYPGYCYHILENRLYSYKSGVLKPLKLMTATHFSSLQYGTKFYRISHQGERKTIVANSTMILCLKNKTAVEVVPWQKERA